MQNPLKDFLYFSREEKRGILILIAGIILVFLSGYLYSYQRNRHLFTEEDIRRQTAAVAECDSFIASVQKKEKQWKQRFPKNNHKREQKENIVLSTFDPNTADSLTLCRLGLPDWMVRNILKYRKKGGRFRKTEDFKKIYGLTEAQYHALLPYIHISRTDTATTYMAQLYTPPAAKDTTAHLYKYPAGTVIDLNRADTTELKKIPGIGSGIARMIAHYRQRLGGFHNIRQLQEINLDFHRLKPWFHINGKDIRLINLNRAGIESLRNHPYINFYQAKAFVEYRKKKGRLHSLKPFGIYEEFSEMDLERISHYVCFE